MLVIRWITGKLKGISGRFILLYFAAFIIPLSVFTIFSYRYSDNSTRDRLAAENRQYLQHAFSVIEENASTCRSVATVAANARAFVEFAAGDMTADMLKLIRFRYGEYNQIESMKATNPRISNIRFFFDNAKMYEIYGILYSETRLGVLHMNGERGRMFAARTESDLPAGQTGRNETEASYYLELRDASGHIGFVEVCMHQRVFFEPVYNEDTITVSIVQTEDGSLLYKEDKLDAPRQVILACLPDISFPQAENSLITLNGKVYAAAKAVLPSMNAVLYQLTSRESVMEDMRSARTTLFAAAGVSTVFFFAALIVTTNILLKKLRRISGSISQVQAGNLDAVIPVNGTDEIDMLARDYNRMTVDLKEMIRKLLEEQKALRVSEVKALQAQIHSHFMYNVLESLRMMAELNNEQVISQAIADLGKLMRYSINWQDQEVTLQSELDMAAGYIKLMNLISDMPVTLEMKVDPALEGLLIPKMSIQPLIENSVVHGIEPKGSNGLIRITARAENDMADIEVYDNGRGLAGDELDRVTGLLTKFRADALSHNRSGIGLDNVNERLIRRYCGRCSLNIESEYGIFTRITLKIPITG
jgi:two-component system sensor histidine kinase YesM